MFVVPALLAVAWLGCMAARRRVGGRFFVAAFGVALLCFPGGAIAARLESSGASCPEHDPHLCVSSAAATLWMDGLLGLGCCVVLLALTLAIVLIRRLVPAVSGRGDG
jgi:hypothetical protein